MTNSDDPVDTARLQRDAIEALAAESGQPVSVVAGVYEAEVARLREDARILDFVPLFAARRTRETLIRNTSPRAGTGD